MLLLFVFLFQRSSSRVYVNVTDSHIDAVFDRKVSSRDNNRANRRGESRSGEINVWKPNNSNVKTLKKVKYETPEILVFYKKNEILVNPPGGWGGVSRINRNKAFLPIFLRNKALWSYLLLSITKVQS